MRAPVLQAAGQTPRVTDFGDPTGDDVVDVTLAGCNPRRPRTGLRRDGPPEVPRVVGKEGVGITADGSRVYFDSPPTPFGSWAERVPVNPEKTYPVPDGVDDDIAVALGIAGLAAWLPLTRHADVSAGQSVLILGATGVVGTIAVQAASILGAGLVVGAGRNREALEKTRDLGADDAAALKSAAGEGFDVVVDLVYGDPFLAALEATDRRCCPPRASLISVPLSPWAHGDRLANRALRRGIDEHTR